MNFKTRLLKLRLRVYFLKYEKIKHNAITTITFLYIFRKSKIIFQDYSKNKHTNYMITNKYELKS